MARRRKKGRGRKKGAFPILATLPVAVPLIETWRWNGKKLTPVDAFGEHYLYEQTGYAMSDGQVHFDKVGKVIGLAIIGMVGHKLAGKLGINSKLKKLTLGYLQL